MNQVQIQVFKLQFLQGFLKRGHGQFITHRIFPDLAHDKQIFAGYTGLHCIPDALSHPCFIAVKRRSIDQTVAILHSLTNTGTCLEIVQQICAEADFRHIHTI